MTKAEKLKEALEKIEYPHWIPMVDEAIAEAIQVERQRCAEIARNPKIAPYVINSLLGGCTIPLAMREHLAKAIEEGK